MRLSNCETKQFTPDNQVILRLSSFPHAVILSSYDFDLNKTSERIKRDHFMNPRQFKHYILALIQKYKSVYDTVLNLHERFSQLQFPDTEDPYLKEAICDFDRLIRYHKLNLKQIAIIETELHDKYS